MIDIQCCDCLDGLKGIQDKSIDCVVTSPPYNVGTKYGSYKDKRTDYLSWTKQVFGELNRVLIDKGHFFLQVGGTSSSPLIPMEVLQQALGSGFILQNEIVWVKNITVNGDSYGQFKPLNTDKYLNNTHELIFHLTKNGFIPIDKIATGVPYKWKSNIKRFKHKRKLRCRGNVWYIPYETIQKKAERFNHPATFPIELPKMCIQLSGISKGATVLDPFLGIGSTLVASRELGMNGIGFDIDQKYIEATEKRLS